jgi:hypothetical protein
MPSPTNGPPAAREDADLPRIFIGIVIIEIFVVAGLYWVGRYFG